MKYSVEWEGEVDAETPEDAAREARTLLKSGLNAAMKFRCIAGDGTYTEIDLRACAKMKAIQLELQRAEKAKSKYDVKWFGDYIRGFPVALNSNDIAYVLTYAENLFLDERGSRPGNPACVISLRANFISRALFRAHNLGVSYGDLSKIFGLSLSRINDRCKTGGRLTARYEMHPNILEDLISEYYSLIRK